MISIDIGKKEMIKSCCQSEQFPGEGLLTCAGFASLAGIGALLIHVSFV